MKKQCIRKEKIITYGKEVLCPQGIKTNIDEFIYNNNNVIFIQLFKNDLILTRLILLYVHLRNYTYNY